MPLDASEDLPRGADTKWIQWKCLNRVRTGMGHSKVTLNKWGHTDNDDLDYDCGSESQTMQHLLRCPLLEQVCSADDLATHNDIARNCVQQWLNTV